MKPLLSKHYRLLKTQFIIYIQTISFYVDLAYFSKTKFVLVSKQEINELLFLSIRSTIFCNIKELLLLLQYLCLVIYFRNIMNIRTIHHNIYVFRRYIYWKTLFYVIVWCGQNADVHLLNFLSHSWKYKMWFDFFLKFSYIHLILTIQQVDVN